MVKITNSNFSLEQIANSGQCFRMREIDSGSYEIISKDKYLTAHQSKGSDELFFETDEKNFEEYWLHYFDLETDYGRFISSVDESDLYLYEAVKIGSGIRILNQDLWEMIVSFLISQQNNIPRIRKCIDNICRKYGDKCLSDKGIEYYAFPSYEQLSMEDEDALMECNLGYRSKYVVRTAKAFANNELSLQDFENLTYENAKAKLLSLYGVGNKVSDCIALFALHHIEAFPIDTHIKQILDAHYKNGFPFDKYEGYAGVMQQYMFYRDIKK